MFAGILQAPWFPPLVLVLFVLLLVFLFALLLRFVLRFAFRQIRYKVCLLLAGLIGGSTLLGLGASPIQKSSDSPVAVAALAAASSQFKGVFANQLPLLAWRMEEVPNDSATPSDDDLRVKVSYFPVGEVILDYDPATQTFQLDQPLDQGSGAKLITSFFKGVSKDILEALPQ